MMLSQTSTNQRNLGIDILRLLAIYAIIAQHTSGGFLVYNAFNNGFEWWMQGVIYGSIFKWASAIFVMISGAYMLEEKRTENINYFLKKRFKRVIIPFLVWVLIYKIASEPSSILNFNFSIFKFFIIDIISGNVEYHLWFIYMLAVLYLITPLLSIFVNKAPKQVIYYMLGIWGLFNIIPDFLGGVLGINFGANYYLEFNKFSGFYILGYVLKDFKVKKPWLLFIPFLLFSAINIIGTYYLSIFKGSNDYFFLERFNFTNIANAILLFVSINSINWGKYVPQQGQLSKWISKISLVSYGIFLNHVLILHFLRSGNYGFKIIAYEILEKPINPAYGIPIILIITIISSTSLALIISKIPFLNKILI